MELGLYTVDNDICYKEGVTWIVLYLKKKKQKKLCYLRLSYSVIINNFKIQNIQYCKIMVLLMSYVDLQSYVALFYPILAEIPVDKAACLYYRKAGSRGNKYPWVIKYLHSKLLLETICDPDTFYSSKKMIWIILCR